MIEKKITIEVNPWGYANPKLAPTAIKPKIG